ncbi:MAG TPA: hypothetical protein VF331_20735 [Polyangiales bacterium]
MNEGSIGGNKLLTDVDLPVLTTAAAGFSLGGPALSHINLPKLAIVGGPWTFSQGEAVTTLALPALTRVDGNCSFVYGTKLTSLSVPLLKTVGGILSVAWNPMLPACQASAVRDNLVGFTGMAELSGNLGTCP